MSLYVYPYLIYLVGITHTRVAIENQGWMNGIAAHPALILCVFKGIAVMLDGACAVYGVEASAGITLMHCIDRSLRSIWEWRHLSDKRH
jgi:hypothetical protein